MKNGKLSGLMLTPLAITIVGTAVMLGIELLLMTLLHQVLIPALPFTLSHVAWDVIDAVTLTAILSLALYFLVFRRLHESEERFRQINAAAQDGVVIVNGQGRITDWNLAAQRLFQYSEEEAVGQPLHQLIVPPRYHADAARGFASFEETGEGPLIGKTAEISALRKDGSEFSAEHSISAVKVKGRWHAIGIIRDITERKRAEQVLRNSEAKYRLLIEGLQEGIWMIDKDANTSFVNLRMAQMLGYSVEEMLGRPLFSFMDERGREIAAQMLERRKQGIREQHDFEFLRKDGSRTYFVLGTSPILDQDGNYAGALACVMDVSECKHQEERTAALLELSISAETLDEKTLLQRGLDMAQHLTGSRIGFLHFISEDQNEIELVTWSTDTLAHYCQARFDRHYPVSAAGIWVDSVQLKQPLIINDYATAPGKKGYPEGHADVQRFISVPILEGGLVRMIVGVGNAARDYDEHDVETVRLFGYDLYRIVRHKRAEDALRESEERLYHLFENMSSGVAVYQPDAACEAFTFKSLNKAGERIDQIRREDVMGRSVEEAFPGVRAFGLLEVFRRVCRSGSPERFPTAFYRDERISGWRDNYVYRLESGEIVAVYDDVSERKANQEALIRANRALMTLSASNEALVHARSEEELLQSVTRAIVEQGGYCMARVSYADDNPEKSLRRVAWAGTGEDFSAEQFLTWADTGKGQMPIARTIRSGTPQVCRDIASDPEFAPWKAAALAQGYASNIGLPLSDGRRTFGGLSVYSSGKDAFGGEEAKLLTELTNNLAFGIVTLRARIEHMQAEQKRLEAGILLKDALEDAVGAIAATLEQRDPYTAGHQRRVAQLATAIGEEMGLAHEVLEGIHFGGLIHDLGKISVPAEIMGKPGRLTDIEFGLIKVHAEAGYQIVKEVAFPWPVADMVRQHHERLDGSGYPQGLKGEQIVLEARILAVADVVEAMSANRPYRPGFGMDAALGEIARGRGTQFDSVAVDACLRVIREKGFVFIK